MYTSCRPREFGRECKLHRSHVTLVDHEIREQRMHRDYHPTGQLEFQTAILQRNNI